MSKHDVAGLTVADVVDSEVREASDGEKYRELVAAHNMQQNLLAMELRLLHATVQKQGRVHSEMRDSLQDLSKPDATQDAILKELRAMKELFKDAVEAMQTLVAMKTNGHATEH